MYTAALFSSLQLVGFSLGGLSLSPIELSGSTLIDTLIVVAKESVSSFSGKPLHFHGRALKSLVRKIEILILLFEYLEGYGSDNLFPSTIFCFRELYTFLWQWKRILDCYTRSSQLWLLIQNNSISSCLQNLNNELSTILDVFPVEQVELCEDIREQIELLKKQLKHVKVSIDQRAEAMRLRLFDFLDQFEVGREPDRKELQVFFVEQLGIRDAKCCMIEIEFIEKLLHFYNENLGPPPSVIKGIVALIRYYRFLIFGFEDGEETTSFWSCREASMEQVPKQFCCPISMDLMRDPVIVSTGQTYDRAAIAQWIEEGNYNCPKTSQLLAHTDLVPNQTLRILISRWCLAHGIPFDHPQSACSEIVLAASPTRATFEADRATARLLLEQLSSQSDNVKAAAAHELQLLAKNGGKYCACIGEAGAIPLLRKVLSSANPVAQENSMTAILNLSIYENNKNHIMEEAGCLESIVKVLRFGHTEEARENAAATLFSLAAVHHFKLRIMSEEGAIEALARLLKEGTPRGKKNALTALFNLSTHADTCSRMIEAGAVRALLEALETEGLAEVATGVLALLVRQPIGVEGVRKEEMAVPGLIEMMRRGSPKGKENAVAVLLDFYRCGGLLAMERVARVPAIADLLQTIICTGTNRATRKAESLLRVILKCEALDMPFWGWGVGYASNSARSSTSSSSSDASIATSVMDMPFFGVGSRILFHK